MEILGHENCWDVKQLLVVAKYLGIEVTVGKLEKDDGLFGNWPVLKTKDLELVGTRAIEEFFCEQKEKDLLKGKSNEVNCWIDLAGRTTTNLSFWVGAANGKNSFIQPVIQQTKKEITAILIGLNNYLVDKTYLVGEAITLADIVMAGALIPAFVKVLFPQFVNKFGNVLRWFKTFTHQEQVLSVYGELELCKTEFKPQRKKKQQPKKKQQKKPQPKKKQQRKVNPLDQLPKSSMELDEWKRQYSNTKTREQAIPWLLENFDKEGYCLYISHYKYPEENEQAFVACNLASGFMQRLEPLRKYGFGSLCILGENRNYTIAGAWIFRGTGIPFEMTNCDDFEVHEFVKCDLDKADDKEYFEDLLAADGKLRGKKCVDWKCFK
ncbi:elongation factor 1-gamma [Anaeramoeba flamelloides]|uniref:Elongation factor 1-gamma n=1 Tax=Anaeramoeba flamelloides TaxID=1746091 RepID=A0AAV8A3Z5_9EUKA|nr:elongation factor 1-gamma [Anaeramoeba flamelloides]